MRSAKTALKLDPSQETARNSLIDRLTETSKQLLQFGDAQTPILSRRDEIANVFGVFGPRGAGKSTVLSALESYSGPSDAEEVATGLGRLRIVERLDCSVVPPGIEPGMAVLLHLASNLGVDGAPLVPEVPLGEKPWASRCSLCGQESQPSKAVKSRMTENLQRLLSTYFQMTKDARDLRLELASSPEDFGDAVVKDVRRRFALSQDLYKWLEEAAPALKRDTFVMLLDDFDLVPADTVRGWFMALLDELRQTRLLFVITADFHRLEHLVFDPKIEWDDKTSRAILHKLLPWQNRISLDLWRRDSALEFSPRGSEGKSLGELIEKGIERFRHHSSLIFQLLPMRPRGLRNLHGSLEVEIEDRSPDESPLRSNRAGGHSFENFLSLLATSRHEPLLARHLSESSLGEWVGLLPLRFADLNAEDWRETCSAARGRAENEPNSSIPKALQPLKGLEIQGTQLPIRSRFRPAARSSKRDPVSSDGDHLSRGSVREEVISEFVRREPRGSDESLHDPLRHGDLWLDSLRDAEGPSRPYWAELLLDLSFSGAATGDPALALHNRVRLLSDWRPAARRLLQCCLSLEVSPQAVRDLFSDCQQTNLHSLLYWLDLEVLRGQGKTDSPGGSNQGPAWVRVEIGWSPLLLALRGERNPLMPEQLDGLFVDPSEVQGGPPEPGPPETLRILPDKVWAMVLLVDALHRCPWGIFSARRGWRLGTYVALAGAFVRGAYVHALLTAERLKMLDLEGKLGEFVAMLNAGTYKDLVQLDEDLALDWIAELLGSHVRLPEEEDSLSTAARAYFSLSTSQAVVDLVDELRL